MKKNICISGIKFCITNDNNFDHIRKNLLTQIEMDILAGMQVISGSKYKFGWSVLTFDQMDDGINIFEPDFDLNPFEDKREDITCTLLIQDACEKVLTSLKVAAEPWLFYQKVIYAKGVLEKPDIYMHRIQPNQMDSGWFIGDTNNSDKSQLEAIYAYQLIKRRPGLIRVLALPKDYMVLFSNDSVIGVSDGNNHDILGGKNI